MSNPLPQASGFFGKIPSLGDFVSRRLVPPFRDEFDDWLQAGLVASRSALGSDWLPTYLGCPIWRFVIAQPDQGQGARAGVWLPSVDRAGRYFPFAIISAPIEQRSVRFFLEDLQPWFDQVEQLAQTVLQEGFVLESFDQRVAQLELPSAFDQPQLGLDRPVRSQRGAIVYSGVDFEYLTSRSLSVGDIDPLATLAKVTVWWTAGSSLVEPCLLVHDTLPSAASFAALLDGQWQSRGFTMSNLIDARQ